MGLIVILHGKREGYGFSFAKIETDWKVGLLFCYTLISGSRKGVAMSKFLSYEDRMIIAQRLQENASFGAIGKELGKDRTTIAKEIVSVPAGCKYVCFCYTNDKSIG